MLSLLHALYTVHRKQKSGSSAQSACLAVISCGGGHVRSLLDGKVRRARGAVFFRRLHITFGSEVALLEQLVALAVHETLLRKGGILFDGLWRDTKRKLTAVVVEVRSHAQRESQGICEEILYGLLTYVTR